VCVRLKVRLNIITTTTATVTAFIVVAAVSIATAFCGSAPSRPICSRVSAQGGSTSCAFL
jgi:hypothetical protein